MVKVRSVKSGKIHEVSDSHYQLVLCGHNNRNDWELVKPEELEKCQQTLNDALPKVAKSEPLTSEAINTSTTVSLAENPTEGKSKAKSGLVQKKYETLLKVKNPKVQ